ncbi:hypothetical protein [Chengkuizengella axinellae]|uniref:Barstar (barnase inhibitor) domain-containing protein n=1 Tax=Chengkuizengella axinellae TaxID=3064388 RepID=A0ABT9J3P6_9BACL|nr:hypothetical protein [Chengkuizengella sp. 2205SS18-9]MDP5276183.1 hypothetical protein [Chengkuizengella sp. 2205SS18-9]
MEYKINYVSLNEMINIKAEIEQDRSLFIAEINSNCDIKSLQDYLTTMTKVFSFPIPSKGLDGYNDWMTDLDWLEKDGYVLIIYNYKGFLSQDLISKKNVIDGFTNHIFPFWQEEVTKVVVEGRVKPFILYLVD